MVTRWTQTPAILWVTGSLISTLTDMSTALTCVSPGTGLRAGGANITQRTHTCPCGRVTSGPILTVTLVFTAYTKHSLFTTCH